MNEITNLIRESWAYKMFGSSRFKSLYWRIGGQALALLLMEIQAYVTDLHPHWIGTVLLGLVISEITKYLNKPKYV